MEPPLFPEAGFGPFLRVKLHWWPPLWRDTITSPQGWTLWYLLSILRLDLDMLATPKVEVTITVEPLFYPWGWVWICGSLLQVKKNHPWTSSLPWGWIWICGPLLNVKIHPGTSLPYGWIWLCGLSLKWKYPSWNLLSPEVGFEYVGASSRWEQPSWNLFTTLRLDL